jgi:hypothetical protein
MSEAHELLARPASNSNSSSLLLSKDEVAEITGYQHASKQLSELHKRGFYRAMIGRSGRVVIERAHYESVCKGIAEKARPRIIPPRKAA